MRFKNALFLLLFCCYSLQGQVNIEKWKVFELTVNGPASGNPFKDVKLTGKYCINSDGNHPGIIDYSGTAYLFGFNFDILKKNMSKNYEKCSIFLENITYNPDGTIQKLPFWSITGVRHIGGNLKENRIKMK